MKVLIDERLTEKCKKALKKRGFELIHMPPSNHLDVPVSSHPDMLVSVIDGTLYTEKTYYLENKAIFDNILCGTDIRNVVLGQDCSPPYPSDIKYNVLYVGGKVYCHKNAEKEIIKAKPCKIIKQGYAACSSLIIDTCHVICADKSIYNSLKEDGTDVCLISNGAVALSHYGYGFIGGASGVFGDTVYFTGDITKHTDFKIINEYIESCGKHAVSLSDEPLYDYGKLIFL